MTFGNTLRARRIARGMASGGSSPRHFGADIADDESVFSEQDIEKIENGGVPSKRELELLVAALFDPDDPQRERFIEFARIVQHAGLIAAETRSSLRRMLGHAAMLIGGRPHRLSSEMQVLRSDLGDVFDRMADRLLVTEPTMEIEYGARVRLADCKNDTQYLDVTLENVGGGDARSVALLLPGPVMKRGTKSLVPFASMELAARTGIPKAEGSALVEYADPAASIYIQYLNDPDSRSPIHARVLERPLTWWDVNRFIVERLHGEPFRFELSAMDAPVVVDADPSAEDILRKIDRPSRTFRRVQAIRAGADARRRPTGDRVHEPRSQR